MSVNILNLIADNKGCLQKDGVQDTLNGLKLVEIIIIAESG